MRVPVRLVTSIPGPLVLLLCAVAAVGASWALIVPPGQAPDEPAHTGYAQVVAEDLRLPDGSDGLTFSREQQLADERANSLQTAQVVETRPEWSELAERDWEREAARIPADSRGEGGHADDVFGINPAHSNPPLYYLYESVAYRAASGGDFFDRLYAMRLWSVLLLLVATAATWLLVGELTGGRPALQLAGAAVVGLQPMATFISGSINPDALLIASFALAFWLGARILRRGLTLRDGIALAAVTAVAVLTKGTGYALVPAVALTIALGAWRLRPSGIPTARIAVASAVVFAVPVGAWLAWSRALGRSAVNEVASASAGNQLDVGLIDYLWQFYLPKPPFLGAVPAIDQLPAYDVWIKTGWAAFGWLEVRFPEPVYVLLAIVTVGLVVGGVTAVLRHGGRTGLLQAAFLGLIALALLAGLHWIEYRTIVNQGVIFNQGRYLLPLLPILGACAAGTLALLPARVRMPAVGVLVGSLFTLQLFSLGVNIGRFYA
jgi:4-amino-4-deoxy-L-arabinose transferase-like glycosyltransferase